MGVFKRLQEQFTDERQRQDLELEKMLQSYLRASYRRLAENANQMAKEVYNDDEYAVLELIAEMEEQEANFDDYYNDSEFLEGMKRE